MSMVTAEAVPDAAGTRDRENVALFDTLAADWWNPEGQSKLLHRVNPARLGFIRAAAVEHFRLDGSRRHVLAGLEAADIGCGAGLVAEPLARMGARVTGLDAGTETIAAARAHAEPQGLSIAYRTGEVAELAAERAGSFDLVTCLEVVEHVADVPAFLASLRRLLKPEGLLVFSTPNRTLLSWAVMIGAAERVLKLIPEGGHEWTQFLTPDEMIRHLAQAGLVAGPIRGIGWSAIRGFHIGEDVRVNYIGTATPA